MPDLNLIHTEVVCHHMKERIQGKLGQDDLLSPHCPTGSPVGINKLAMVLNGGDFVGDI
jgi:hypothetical protein